MKIFELLYTCTTAVRRETMISPAVNSVQVFRVEYQGKLEFAAHLAFRAAA